MDAMAAAYLLAAYKGVDLAANRENVSVIALVAAGYLTADLTLTAIGEVSARRAENDFKDWHRSLVLAGAVEGP